MTIQFQITRCADLQSLQEFRDLIDRACKSIPTIDEETRYDLKLAVDETCTNIILHGYSGMDPGSIILNIEINTEAVQVTISDYGHAFETVEIDTPDPEGLTEEGIEELGLFFIHQVTDALEYESSSSGNQLTMVKNLKRKDQR